jgi:hypothetical protein
MRHATFYIFYAKFPNIYLRDIVQYGAKYRTLANNPHQITIQQSKPFCMRQPKQQAEFFKLLSTLFYYMISGESNIGYLAKDEWNPYYTEKNNLHVLSALVFANVRNDRCMSALLSNHTGERMRC